MSIATRDGFGNAIVKLGENPKVVVLDADLCSSTRSEKFGEKYPERYFNVGIAEQNLVGLAVGLAKTGKIPFACSFASFLPNRAHDQIRMSVAYNKANVKLVASHAGLLTGEDGASAQELGDIGTMRTLPGMTIIQPADGTEAELATQAIAQHQGPCYLRLTRSKVPDVMKEYYGNTSNTFQIGKGVLLKGGDKEGEEGEDAVIFATGVMVSKALDAAKILENDSMRVAVINIHTIKPLDEELVLKYAKKTGAVVTAEDHSVIGGLGSAVSEFLAEHLPTAVERIGMHDSFGESGKGEELYGKYGMNTKHMVEAVKSVVARKKREKGREDKREKGITDADEGEGFAPHDPQHEVVRELMRKTLLRINEKLEKEKIKENKTKEKDETKEQTPPVMEPLTEIPTTNSLILKTQEARCTNMELFVDTADVEAIKRLHAWGVLDGVTTNPSLIAKEGRDFKQVVKEICAIVQGPVSAEVVATDVEGMLKEGRELAKIDPHVVVKVPLTPAGLQATKILTGEEIKVNVTLCFSANQALLAAKAGATYISPFIGRLDDIGQTGMTLIKEILVIYKNYGFTTKVLTASVRHPEHVKEAAMLGSHVCTLPPAVFEQMIKHALTDIGLEKFLKDWDSHKQNQQTEHRRDIDT